MNCCSWGDEHPAESTGLWFDAGGGYEDPYPLCSVNAPTQAPTLSPVPAVSMAPTFPFTCDNDMCTSWGEDCCASMEWDEELTCGEDYVPIALGDHYCVYTCWTGADVEGLTHEEITEPGHELEYYEEHHWWDDHHEEDHTGWVVFFFAVWFSGWIGWISTCIYCCCCKNKPESVPPARHGQVQMSQVVASAPQVVQQQHMGQAAIGTSGPAVA